MEQRLKARGALKVNLHVERWNESVVRFYESLGYKIDDLVFLGKHLAH